MGPWQQGSLWVRIGIHSWVIQKHHADVIMIRRVVMFLGPLVTMAMLGMEDTVICLGQDCIGTVLQSLDARCDG
jgi:hypothetical protein